MLLQQGGRLLDRTLLEGLHDGHVLRLRVGAALLHVDPADVVNPRIDVFQGPLVLHIPRHLCDAHVELLIQGHQARCILVLLDVCGCAGKFLKLLKLRVPCPCTRKRQRATLNPAAVFIEVKNLLRVKGAADEALVVAACEKALDHEPVEHFPQRRPADFQRL